MAYENKSTHSAPLQLLTEKEVSVITTIPVKTLQNWRCIGEGPAFIKLGTGPKARVKYDLVDIQNYVNAGRRYPSVRATQKEEHGHHATR